MDNLEPPLTAEEREVRMWAMILHLSQFASYIFPVAGVVAPILIWQIQREKMPELDAHGKIVVNWLISLLIYAVISTVLIFVIVGIFLLIALGVMAIVFPIIGAIRANEGEAWKYPLTIPFLK